MKRLTNITFWLIPIAIVIALGIWRYNTPLDKIWYPVDYIGIAALGITLFTAIKAFFINKDVQKLSSKYSLKMILPSAKNRLEKIRKKLNPLLRQDSNINDTSITLVIANCHSECEDLDKKIKELGITILSTNDIINICHEIKQRGRRSTDDINNLYYNICKLITDLDKIIRDFNNEVNL
jgi:hypothetical protein